jgi:hypothetical protein
LFFFFKSTVNPWVWIGIGHEVSAALQEVEAAQVGSQDPGSMKAWVPGTPTSESSSWTAPFRGDFFILRESSRSFWYDNVSGLWTLLSWRSCWLLQLILLQYACYNPNRQK